MNFTKVGVIGAGTMGSGIAQKIAQENIPVVMVDTKQEFVDKGINNIRKLLDEGVQKKIFSPERVQKVLANIKGTTDMNELKDADLIIEAVFEDEKVKKDLFRNLDSICADKTIFASNTSSFRVGDLATATKRPDRFVGLHYFYHPAKNRLLEIIPGKATSDESVERAMDFANRTSKTAIVVKDAPGFAVNRFFVPWLNEAVRILEENAANIATIDEAAKQAFKIGMGPFLLMNVTGIPIAYHSTETLSRELGKFYATAKKLKEQFESKKEWDLSGAVVEPQRHPATYSGDKSKLEQVGERLLAVVFYVAGQLVDEGVATIEDIDRGAKIGLRWEKGPFELMNAVGVAKARQMVEKVCQKYAVPVPKIISQQGTNPWSFRLVDLNIKQDIATITVNRPEALNALNEDVVSQLGDVFQKAEADPKVKVIVIEGKGKAFVAGADISFFVRKIDEKKLQDIVEFTRKGQELLMRIDKSSKIVIAKLDGLALGGGAELALACDVILMTERGSIGFPETGIGIYPGLGGTQRLPRLVGKAVAKYLLFTGEILNAKQAQEIGLARYSAVAEVNKKVAELVSSMIGKSLLPEATVIMSADMVKVKGIFSDEKIGAVLSGGLLKSSDELEAKIGKKVSFKAPLAVKLANRIMDEGMHLSLEEGIKIELAHLTEIFSTKDAYEGLTSVLQRRRPVFKGG